MFLQSHNKQKCIPDEYLLVHCSKLVYPEVAPQRERKKKTVTPHTQLRTSDKRGIYQEKQKESI